MSRGIIAAIIVAIIGVAAIVGWRSLNGEHEDGAYESATENEIEDEDEDEEENEDEAEPQADPAPEVSPENQDEEQTPAATSSQEGAAASGGADAANASLPEGYDISALQGLDADAAKALIEEQVASGILPDGAQAAVLAELGLAN